MCAYVTICVHVCVWDICIHVCMCACVCICVCMYAYMHVYVCVFKCTCFWVYVFLCMHVYGYVCKCVYVYMYRYMCMCVSMCGLVCICFQEKELLLWECIVAKIFLFLNILRCRFSPGTFLVDAGHGCSSHHSKGLLGRTSFITLCLFLAKGS